ncbi:SHOCT domain-containing protein [Haloarchaeobius sp. TZWWS8]|uniref:SHOCT domain-containing protein n=1 Tax=Haloarchaeobius sp. TZWWS8 TaxID=3446121 RepID=UPI003EB85703
MTDDEDFFEKLPALVVFATLGLTIALSMLDLPYAGMVAAIGFAVVLPLSAIFQDDLRRLFGGRTGERASDTTPESDALEELKRRYAAGGISEEEFEHRAERLLENESLDDVQARVDRTRQVDRARQAESDADAELEHES